MNSASSNKSAIETFRILLQAYMHKHDSLVGCVERFANVLNKRSYYDRSKTMIFTQSTEVSLRLRL